MEDRRSCGHRRCPRILRLLSHRLCVGLHHYAVAAHLPSVGSHPALLGCWRHRRCLYLGLRRRPDRPPQGIHRDGHQFLGGNRRVGAHPRAGLDLSYRAALPGGFRRWGPLLRRSASGAGVHADIEARLHRRSGHLLQTARHHAGAVLGAYLAPLVGWRGLFAVGLLPALLTLLIRAWVPESPRWLARMGRAEEAREALGWALKIDPKTIPLS